MLRSNFTPFEKIFKCGRFIDGGHYDDCDDFVGYKGCYGAGFNYEIGYGDGYGFGAGLGDGISYIDGPILNNI